MQSSFRLDIANPIAGPKEASRQEIREKTRTRRRVVSQVHARQLPSRFLSAVATSIKDRAMQLFHTLLISQNKILDLVAEVLESDLLILELVLYRQELALFLVVVGVLVQFFCVRLKLSPLSDFSINILLVNSLIKK